MILTKVTKTIFSLKKKSFFSQLNKDYSSIRNSISSESGCWQKSKALGSMALLSIIAINIPYPYVLSCSILSVAAYIGKNNYIIHKKKLEWKEKKKSNYTPFLYLSESL